MDKLYIIIPAYNEEENIEKVVSDWYQVIEKMNKDSKLVVIDDGSKDNTYKILCELSKKYSKLVPITKENEGHGATLLYGYNYAIENGADYIFQTDSDGQTLSSEFWDFWKDRENYDMVIGHRRKRQDGFSRIIVTKLLKLIILLIVKDANTPFRLMKVSTLKKKIKLVPPKFNLSNVIISVIYRKHKLPVKYMEITFKPRQGGKNSINIKKIFKIGLKALSDFIKINKSLKGDIND